MELKLIQKISIMKHVHSYVLYVYCCAQLMVQFSIRFMCVNECSTRKICEMINLKVNSFNDIIFIINKASLN